MEAGKKAAAAAETGKKRKTMKITDREDRHPERKMIRGMGAGNAPAQRMETGSRTAGTAESVFRTGESLQERRSVKKPVMRERYRLIKTEQEKIPREAKERYDS